MWMLSFADIRWCTGCINNDVAVPLPAAVEGILALLLLLVTFAVGGWEETVGDETCKGV